MRAVLTLVVLFCIGAIIYGNFHWNDKLGSAVDREAANALKGRTATAPVVVENMEETNEGSFDNLPIEASEFLKKKINDGGVVELVIIGSEVNELADKNWAKLFKEELESTYNGLFNITVNSVTGEVTTVDVVNEDLHLNNITTVPDIVILEPFLLDSNGLIRIEHSLENISIMIEDLKDLNPDLFLFLQPGQPLRNAIYYPLDVEELELWSKEEGYTYINHWENWPKESEELSDYIKTEDIQPNEKGHKVWAEYLINYFTGKSSKDGENGQE